MKHSGAEVLWLIVSAQEELEPLPDAKEKPDLSLIYPVDPKQLPKGLASVEWPPKQFRIATTFFRSWHQTEGA